MSARVNQVFVMAGCCSVITLSLLEGCFVNCVVWVTIESEIMQCQRLCVNRVRPLGMLAAIISAGLWVILAQAVRTESCDLRYFEDCRHLPKFRTHGRSEHFTRVVIDFWEEL